MLPGTPPEFVFEGSGVQGLDKILALIYGIPDGNFISDKMPVMRDGSSSKPIKSSSIFAIKFCYL